MPCTARALLRRWAPGARDRDRAPVGALLPPGSHVRDVLAGRRPVGRRAEPHRPAVAERRRRRGRSRSTWSRTWGPSADVSLAFGLAERRRSGGGRWVLTRAPQPRPRSCRTSTTSVAWSPRRLSARASAAASEEPPSRCSPTATRSSPGGPLRVVRRGDPAHRAVGDAAASLREQAGTVETVLQWTSLLGVVLLDLPTRAGHPAVVPALPCPGVGRRPATAVRSPSSCSCTSPCVSVLTAAGLGPIATTSRPTAHPSSSDASPGPGARGRPRRRSPLRGQDPAA